MASCDGLDVVIDVGSARGRIEKGLPDFAARKGDGGPVALEGIADGYELLYRQPRAAWSHEIDVQTHKEPF